MGRGAGAIDSRLEPMKVLQSPNDSLLCLDQGWTSFEVARYNDELAGAELVVKVKEGAPFSIGGASA